MANAATLGGHVEVGEFAVVGGIVAVHQFVRIGEYSCIGGFSGVRMDIPPYMLATGAGRKTLRPQSHRPQTARLFRKVYPGDQEILQDILSLRLTRKRRFKKPARR